MFNFGWSRGVSLKEKIRLFYHAGLKPSLAFRGLSRPQPGRWLEFEIQATKESRFRVWVRDNQTDMTTFAEFFSGQHIIIPKKLRAYTPRVIYDIGANIGIASLYFATRYPHAQYYAFEPVPANFEICSANYGNLAKGQTLPWAVGALSGSASFEFDEADLRGGRLEQSRKPDTRYTSMRLTVTVVSIADLVSEKKIAPPDFVKIDVEGAELEVLAGVGSCLSHIKRMLIETHSAELYVRCVEWLQANGFTIQDINEAAPGFAAIWADKC